MIHFETMLMPFGKRVTSLRLSEGVDVNGSTTVEMLDGQEVLETNVLYIGTPKMAAGVLEGCVRLEPACFLVIASGSSSAETLEKLDGDRLDMAEVRTNLPTLFNQISRYLRVTFQREEQRDQQGNWAFTTLWHAVMEQTLTNTEAIRDALSRLYPGLKSFVRVMSVRFDQPQEQEAYDSMAEAIHAILPNVCTGRYGDALVVIASSDERVLRMPVSEDQMEALESLMAERDASMSVSHSFRNLDKLRTNFIFCERVVVLARALKLRDTGRVNTYDRFSMYNVIDLATQQFIRTYGHSDIIYLIHPAIILVTRYDTAHATNLRDTLYYYLVSGNNVSRTAATTYMHRNTVINRINKIVELTGVDLSDGGLCQRLMFSCQLIQYYERVLNLTLKLDDVRPTNNRKGAHHE